jgi:hypothetical protein
VVTATADTEGYAEDTGDAIWDDQRWEWRPCQISWMDVHTLAGLRVSPMAKPGGHSARSVRIAHTHADEPGPDHRENCMAVFVYEIDGLRIAAYGDIDRSRAEAWAQEKAFKSDLNVRDYEGQPIWDEDSEVKVLEASPSEISKWKVARDHAREEGRIKKDDKEWLVFLVPTTQVLEDDAD